MYSVVGSCPDCGAPIWVPSTGWGSFPPAPIYSCPCHTSMHRIMVRTGFATPIAFVQDPADRSLQYVVEQGGRIHTRFRTREI